jgi:hypothetical protein
MLKLIGNKKDGFKFLPLLINRLELENHRNKEKLKLKKISMINLYLCLLSILTNATSNVIMNRFNMTSNYIII